MSRGQKTQEKKFPFPPPTPTFSPDPQKLWGGMQGPSCFGLPSVAGWLRRARAPPRPLPASLALKSGGQGVDVPLTSSHSRKPLAEGGWRRTCAELPSPLVTQLAPTGRHLSQPAGWTPGRSLSPLAGKRQVHTGAAPGWGAGGGRAQTCPET